MVCSQTLGAVGAAEPHLVADEAQLILAAEEVDVRDHLAGGAGDLPQGVLEREEAERRVAHVGLQRRRRHLQPQRRQEQRADQQGAGGESRYHGPIRPDAGDQEQQGGIGDDEVAVADETAAAGAS